MADAVKVGGHYTVEKRIGNGSFGEIFKGEDEKTGEEVAIKLEPLKSKSPQLYYESKLYLIFASGVCIPKLYWYGTEANYNVLIMELLGKSLEDLFVLCDRRFTLKTTLMVIDQMLRAIEYIHSKNFIHRDIKPDNFLMGRREAKNKLYAIDFGLSKKFRDPNTHKHLDFAVGKSLTGTARYASINALKGHEQSRRDDMEALGYVWIYLLRGSLPWMGINAEGEQHKYEKICEVKEHIPLEELCHGLPNEFIDYLKLVRNLEFEEEPAYSHYREMFRNLFIKEGYIFDYQYDWSDKIPEDEPRRSTVINPEVAPPPKKELVTTLEAPKSGPAFRNKTKINTKNKSHTPENQRPKKEAPKQAPSTWMGGRSGSFSNKPKPKSTK